MARKSKKFRFTRKLGLISAAAIVVIVAAGLGFWHYHDRPSQVVIGVAPAKNTTPASANSQAGSDNSSTSSTKQTAPAGGYGASGGKGSGSSGTAGPLTPSGNFISNHHPGQNSPTVETSVCNTTPGAICYIEFTQGNDTLKLQAGTADSNGSVYWNNWDINNYSFNKGQWSITAVATLNGQTATATDATPLTIQ